MRALKDEVEIMLEEYRALRAEITKSMENRNSTITFGFALIGLVLFAVIQTLSDPWLAILHFATFALAVPALSVLVLVLWASERERSRRAGFYLTTLEAKINRACGADVLGWEHWVRERDPRSNRARLFTYPYYATMALFAFLAAGSLTFILGYSQVAVPLKAATGVAMYGLIVWGLAWVLIRAKRWS